MYNNVTTKLAKSIVSAARGKQKNGFDASGNFIEFSTFEVSGRRTKSGNIKKDFGDGQEVSTAAQVSTAKTLMEIRKSAAKDKGKAKMDETESPRKMKQREWAQISRDEEVAQKLQEEFDAAERQRMAQVHQAAQGFTDAEWDDVLARVAADEDFVQQFTSRIRFDREDLVKLWDLVKERFGTTEPTNDKEKRLWVKLKRLFEPNKDDTLWKLKGYCMSFNQDSKVFGSILNTEGLIQKLDDLKVNHKFRGGLLGIRGFYNLMLLVQVCVAADDKRKRGLSSISNV
ncbi:hypothetical protein Tco_0655184 [Tanacetum coccineum]|uniref:Uncharacterized protein n=1 Tax=Tanacetum coccineum TaxID=301880 RepID=A0ABQ4X6A1_9ASTR